MQILPSPLLSGSLFCRPWSYSLQVCAVTGSVQACKKKKINEERKRLVTRQSHYSTLQISVSAQKNYATHLTVLVLCATFHNESRYKMIPTVCLPAPGHGKRKWLHLQIESERNTDFNTAYNIQGRSWAKERKEKRQQDEISGAVRFSSYITFGQRGTLCR